VLSDNVARAPSFGSDSALYFPGYQVAAKTGTTNDYRDAWILGYTTQIAAGAWAGNNDNRPMQKKVAGFIVAPLWNEFMQYAFSKYPPQQFTPPAPDPDSENLPGVLRGSWNTSPTEGIHDILHWVEKGSPRSERPMNPSNDPQYRNWEQPVALWAGSAMISTSTQQLFPVSDFLLAFPYQGLVLKKGDAAEASIEHLDTFPVASVTYYLNGEEIGVATQAPYSLRFSGKTPGPAIMRAVAEGPLGKRENSVWFTIE
jgi:penicillin-binding protein 1A